MFFIRRDCLDHMPSGMALHNRGVRHKSTSCLWCGSSVEDSNHILLRCPIVSNTLRWVLNLYNIPSQWFVNSGSLCIIADDLIELAVYSDAVEVKIVYLPS
ncbi:hypothetical protein LXL04_022798 [Taraxacum kok-saghyz]